MASSFAYEGELLLFVLNVMVTSLIGLPFVVCCRREKIVVVRETYGTLDGMDDLGQHRDDPRNERDGCWIDFEIRTFVNPKDTVVHLSKNCEHVNHGRCKELGVCLDCIDRLKRDDPSSSRPAATQSSATQSTSSFSGHRRRTSMRG